MSDPIRARLDEIQARADRAKGGTWESYHVPAERGKAGYVAVALDDEEMVVPGYEGASLTAHFIAAARTDVPALVAALRAALEVHAKDDCGECSECRAWDESGVRWPCDTVERIAAALGVEVDA